MNMHQYPFYEPPQEESPDGSGPMSLSPQLPLRDLDSELENIEEFFLLGLSQPAQERDGLKKLEADFKESAKTGDLQALQKLINPHLQPPDVRILHNIDFIQNELSLAPKEISDYYQQLIQRTQPGPHDFHSSPDAQMPTDKIVDYTESYRLRYDSARNFIKRLRLVPGQVKELEEKFNEDLGRWKTLSTQNQQDPFGLLEEVVGAAFALKSFPRAAPLYVPGNEGIPPGVANMHPFNPNVFAQLQSVAFDFFLQASSAIQEMYDQGPDLDAPQNTIDNLFGASEDYQAPDQHDSSISMGTPVEDSMYYQMPDEDADDP
ncbi:hypothetical protein ACKAV7_003270 [Fusarium commune]|uniref:Uncharacterized protein n=1 Tax=Fusarium oxysporum f. sp. rapae TaxID=485398 RepID=A0A8J5PCZ8_FUSOX|nr:hypothetical protein Forpe1208_v004019 [Fusarium oxysporum f. sp. rapae]KAI7758539.1 hypothetical protein LZL87_006930 [Fusarium oxysporum]